MCSTASLRIPDYLFSSIRFSFNQQLQIFQYITEICSREGRSINEILDGSEVNDIITDKKMNTPQKAKALTAAIMKRRFPTLSDTERAFKRGISSLSLPPGVNIIPPAFFEGINYRLEVVFSNGKELKEKINKLNKVSGLVDVTDFWKGRATK